MIDKINVDDYNKSVGLKDVKFSPSDFGGYTFSILLTGMFLVWTLTASNWIMGIISLLLMVAMFTCGMIFFSRGNK